MIEDDVEAWKNLEKRKCAKCGDLFYAANSRIKNCPACVELRKDTRRVGMKIFEAALEKAAAMF